MTEPTADSDVLVRAVDALSGDEPERVRALAAAAEQDDGVAPLSEESLLGLDPAAGGRRHLLALDPRDETLLGYAHLDVAARAAEIVVAPARRRQGVGSALWHQVRAHEPTAQLWAHGHLPPAVGFAAAHGLRTERELWQMAAPANALRQAGVPDDPREVVLPEGMRMSTYTDADGPDWVTVNARAFATHPEQGRMTSNDVAARQAQEWFDPAGFFLVRDTTAPGSPLAAFHWTKIEQGEGEVYVVGIDPAYQGRGLGGPVTRLGLAHLLGRGVPRVTLYVDGDNAAALATYHRQGFERVALDVQLR